MDCLYGLVRQGVLGPQNSKMPQGFRTNTFKHGRVLRINFVAPTATGANVRCSRPRSGYRSDKSSRCGPEPTCHANHAHACTYDICTHICTHMPHATCSCCHMPIHMQMRMTHASHCARCDLDHRRVCPRSRGQMITSSVRSL